MGLITHTVTQPVLSDATVPLRISDEVIARQNTRPFTAKPFITQEVSRYDKKCPDRIICRTRLDVEEGDKRHVEESLEGQSYPDSKQTQGQRNATVSCCWHEYVYSSRRIQQQWHAGLVGCK
jgi:hypothetical protein